MRDTVVHETLFICWSRKETSTLSGHTKILPLMFLLILCAELNSADHCERGANAEICACSKVQCEKS